ncbi:MAG: 2-dehydro-3-deoxygluconokinase [Massilibacillus sp.]|jgi:2-dehydro-3-deoxygluconokinase|nr:2-dehydro-3-deoxygluconokinase [Massilibacillus sp.]
MIEVLTIGEPMGLLVADEVKPLENVEHFTRYVAGAEINFAVGMARLEHKVAYVSKLGNDPFGKHIKNFLAENKIDNRYISFDNEHMTGMQLKAKVEVGDPEVVNFRKNTASANMNVNDIAQIDWSTIKHLHITGIPPALSSSCRATIYELITAARKHEVRISFDTNLRPALWKDKQEMIDVINDLAFKCDIVLPGVSEGKLLTGSDDLDEIADFYLKSGVKTVVIKVGAKGAFVKTNEGSFTVPAFKVDHIVDTVGAGDGFAVGVVSALLEGLDLKNAVKRGAAIGALAIMSPGDNDGLPTVAGLKKFLSQQ